MYNSIALKIQQKKNRIKRKKKPSFFNLTRNAQTLRKKKTNKQRKKILNITCSEDNSCVSLKRFNPPNFRASRRRARAARKYFNALFRGRENKRGERRRWKNKRNGRTRPAKGREIEISELCIFRQHSPSPSLPFPTPLPPRWIYVRSRCEEPRYFQA